MDAESVLAALDPEQREVAVSFGHPVVVIAGAGSGKTRALTHRIAYGAHTGQLDPRRTLAVTFTTRAAGELRSRLQQLGVGRVQARTFHSAALRQIQYFWPRAYGVELPQVTDARMSLVAESASRARVSTETSALRDLLTEISWAKVTNVSAGEYPAVARTHAREVSGVDPEAVARVFAGYEKTKTARGQIDFDDILLCTAALLDGFPDIADEVRRTYAHFVVDEFQDVSPLQHTVLGLWLGERRDVCVVGDPNQSIHAFAGATPTYLTRFTAEHPDAQLIRLMRNYRSTPQVVELANRVVAPVNSGVRLRAQQANGLAVEFSSASDEASEADEVATWFAEQRAAGIAWREMAALFRITAQSPALEAALTKRNIPYQVRGAERFYERPEIRRALGVLRAAHQDQERSDSESSSHASPDQLDPVEQVRLVLQSAGWTPEAPPGSGRVREQWESLAALVDAVDTLATEDPSLDFAQLVQTLQHRASIDHAPTGAGVTLSTMHAAKGLEWDAVALFGVNEGSVPFVLATSEAEIAEERRLLHVAITRARQRLRISWSAGRGHNRGPSRFLVGVSPQVASAAPSVDRRRRPRAAMECRVCHLPVSTSAERKLGRHADCASSYSEPLLDALKVWRKQIAEEEKVPAFVIFTDATLMAVAESMPRNDSQLLAVAGIGRTKLERYGADVLQIVQAAS